MTEPTREALPTRICSACLKETYGWTQGGQCKQCGEHSENAARAVEKYTAALRAELERYKRALRRRGLSPAPCDICGYNGAGYYQPSQHECAALEDTK